MPISLHSECKSLLRTSLQAPIYGAQSRSDEGRCALIRSLSLVLRFGVKRNLFPPFGLRPESTKCPTLTEPTKRRPADREHQQVMIKKPSWRFRFRNEWICTKDLYLYNHAPAITAPPHHLPGRPNRLVHITRNTTSHQTNHIAATKEHSLNPDKENSKCGTIDGSGSGDTIGAAAILYLNGNTHAELKYRLGSAKQHTAFEGELTGFILGLHLTRTMLSGHDSITTSSITKQQSNPYKITSSITKSASADKNAYVK